MTLEDLLSLRLGDFLKAHREDTIVRGDINGTLHVCVFATGDSAQELFDMLTQNEPTEPTPPRN